MVRRVIVHDDVLNTCERAELVPYPNVVPIDDASQNAISSIVNVVTGQTTWRVNSDRTTALAAIAGLGLDDRGLSLGEVDIPTNRALLVAEMTQTNANRMSLAFNDMQALFTNRAAEPAAAAGVMNANGQLGFQSRPFFVNPVNWATVAQTIIDENNGPLIQLVLAGAHGNPTLQLPNARYPGQVFVLSVASNDADPPGVWAEINLQHGTTSQAVGILRRTTHEVAPVTAAVAPAGFIVRAPERYLFVANPALNWHILSGEFRMQYGPQFRECADGTTEIWGNTALASATNIVFAAPLPAGLSIVNPGIGLNVQAMRASNTFTAIGAALPAADQNASGVFHHVAPADTATQIALAWHGVTGAPAPSGQVQWRIANARLNYGALGGINSFGP